MHKRFSKTIALLVGVMLTVSFGFTAIAGASAQSTKANKVSCARVAKELKKAEKTVVTASANAKDKSGTPDASKAKAAVKTAKVSIRNLQKRAATCAKKALAATTAPNVLVTESNGRMHSLPLVNADGTVVNGDSTSDPRTPPTYADAKVKGPAQSWEQFVDLMGGMKWYVDGVNARKGTTGFDWSDVQKWATAKDANGPIDARVIQVYNLNYTDQQARDAVRGLVGNDADKLPIARHSCIVNTRGFDHNQMQDFVDCRQMVRVSLSPIVYDNNGVPVSLRSDTGVFVDCFNIWWIPRQIVVPVPPTTPTTVPPKVPPTTVPPTPTTTVPPNIPTCPNGQPIPPNGLCPKDPSQDVNVNPDVPPQVQGPGTTPVGTSPGPSTLPVDTPTGCVGDCPTTVPLPTPTTTTTLPPEPTPVTPDPPASGDPGAPPSS
jgi:hypothetical protein